MLKELIVDDYGVSLHKKSERLVLKKNGQVIKEYAIKELDDLVISNKCGMVSIELIEELINNGTQIHLIDYKHEPFVTIYTPAHHGSIKARREQLTSYYDQRGVYFTKEILRCKLQNQINLLKYYLKSRRGGEISGRIRTEIAAMEDYTAKIKGETGSHIEEIRDTLRSHEALAAKHYWKGVKILLADKISIPGRDHESEDPFNMMLNYGYGILGSRVRSSIIKAGIEPYAGFIHVDRAGRLSLQLDVMEVFRQPIVDRVVISLLSRGLKPGTEVREDGAVMLDSKTKDTLRESLLKRLEGRELYRGKEYMLKTIIQLQARDLATFFRESIPFKGFIARW